MPARAQKQYWDQIAEEMGLFLPSYFQPPDDLRETEMGEIIGSSAYPIATVSEWIYAAGLRDLRLWEPQPLPLESAQHAPTSPRLDRALPQTRRCPGLHYLPG